MKNIDDINKLKEELKIRDKMVEHFRKEALNWARIAKEYQKDKTKLEQTLQEIKEYLEDIDYIAQFDGTPYDLSVEIKQIITKAEEE